MFDLLPRADHLLRRARLLRAAHDLRAAQGPGDRQDAGAQHSPAAVLDREPRAAQGSLGAASRLRAGPDGRPPEQMCRELLPGLPAVRLPPERPLPIDFWLRTERLVEDFIAFVGRLHRCAARARSRSRSSARQPNDYDHDVRHGSRANRCAPLRDQPGMGQRGAAGLRRPARCLSDALKCRSIEVFAVSVPAAMPAKLIGANIDLPKAGRRQRC